LILVKPSYKILTPIDGSRILQSIERAGRTCYKSEDRITDGSAEKFCKSILERGHESVIEHESLSVKFIVDRGVTHELVRHRLCAYSQESTRYCNYKGGVTFVIPPWVDLPEGEITQDDRTQYCPVVFISASVEASPRGEWLRAMACAETAYTNMLAWGWSPQQARSVLPNSLKTEIVCTANLREWRWIFRKRCDSAAHPQMREVMIPLLADLVQAIPVIFDDIWASLKDQPQ
jgi:thymidylate synthase (FAD)